MKTKTYKRLEAEINKLPWGKIKTVFGKVVSKMFREDIKAYAIYLLFYNKDKLVVPTFQQCLDKGLVNFKTTFPPLDFLVIEIEFSLKDGIHFNIKYFSYFLDSRFDEMCASRKSKSRYEKQQQKYAARQYRGK